MWLSFWKLTCQVLQVVYPQTKEVLTGTETFLNFLNSFLGTNTFYRAVLEVIVTKLAASRMAIRDYVKKTLLYHSSANIALDDVVDSTIRELLDHCLITADASSAFAPTRLGQAVVASSLTPTDGIFVYNELKKATEAFAIDGDMHALYIFTPINSLEFDVNWQIFRNEVESLDENGLRVLRLVGIKPTKINKL